MSSNIASTGITKNKHNSKHKPRLVVKWLTDDELFHHLAKCQCCIRHPQDKPLTLTDRNCTKIYQPNKEKQVHACTCNCRLLMRALVRSNVKT